MAGTSSQLSAAPSESVRVADVGSPGQPKYGIVAILDALGAATYSKIEAEQFLASRDRVMEATQAAAENSLKRFEVDRLKRFTFNDTVVLAYLIDKIDVDAVRDVETFCHVLRAFETLSLANGILFRGSVAIGELYRVSEDSGTIMGPSVSDAAAWYGLADWIGIHATPHATILIASLLEQASGSLDHVLVRYAVPFKDGRRIELSAINWPKGFYVRGLAPFEVATTAKAQLLTLLGRHQIPKGAESKYFNTIEFFEFVESGQRLKDRQP